MTTELNYRFAAQPGPQTQFLSSPADIVIYGGAAGGGKTYGVLLDAVRWIQKPSYNCAIFRRETTQLKSPGGIWEESKNMYRAFGGKPNNSEMTWRFPQSSDGALIKMAGLQYEDDKFNYQGAQFDTAFFDELTHFSESQFWYLIGRLRSQGGYVKPYARATCNPEPGWVLDMIEWWIDEEGFPIKSRSGAIRWLIRHEDVIFWFDSLEDAVKWRKENDIADEVEPQSFTFIAATIEDNKILMENDPSYVGKLHALPEIEKKKLLYGNWRVAPSGKLFKSEDFKDYIITPDYDLKIITVDTAQETKTANDYTVMQEWVRYENKAYFESQIRGKFEYDEQLDLLFNMILTKRPHYVIIEAKANGNALAQSIRRKINEEGLTTKIIPIQRNKDKYTRGFSVQGYVTSGYVFIKKRADYYADFISETVSFAPENKNKASIHDDQVDAMIDAIEYLLINKLATGTTQSTSKITRVPTSANKKRFNINTF